jgi:hypothetical protein
VPKPSLRRAPYRSSGRPSPQRNTFRDKLVSSGRWTGPVRSKADRVIPGSTSLFSQSSMLGSDAIAPGDCCSWRGKQATATRWTRRSEIVQGASLGPAACAPACRAPKQHCAGRRPKWPGYSPSPDSGNPICAGGASSASELARIAASWWWPPASLVAGSRTVTRIRVGAKLSPSGKPTATLRAPLARVTPSAASRRRSLYARPLRWRGLACPSKSGGSNSVRAKAFYGDTLGLADANLPTPGPQVIYAYARRSDGTAGTPVSETLLRVSNTGQSGRLGSRRPP